MAIKIESVRVIPLSAIDPDGIIAEILSDSSDITFGDAEMTLISHEHMVNLLAGNMGEYEDDEPINEETMTREKYCCKCLEDWESLGTDVYVDIEG